MQGNRVGYVSLLGGVLLIIALSPLEGYAAELTLAPSSGSFGVGEEFSITVSVNPDGASVNAADGALSFNKDVLSVVKISKDGSVFSLWTAEPSFSNAAGTVSLSGGTPSAFSNTGTVVTLHFKAIAVGSAAISFSSGSILAADGKGTNVYTKGGEATITVTEAAEAEAEEGVDESVPDTAKPVLPVIASLTHPKEDTWYGTSTVEFSWKATSDVTSIRTLFSQNENDTPKDTSSASVTSKTVTGVADGMWYALVQFRNEFGWGDIAKKKILVDTTPPLAFEVTLVEGDTSKLAFQTTDELSGIDKYEILLGGVVAATVKAEELANGTYPTPPQEGGAQKVTIRAHDKAKNIRDAERDLTLPAVAKPSPKGSGGEEEESAPLWTFERILTILFAFVIGVVATWNFYLRKGFQQEKDRILVEVSRARDKNDKIFSALREEFEDLVNNFDTKPQLTVEERELLEKIKEALDLSEELVDSQMEELKKIIRG